MTDYDPAAARERLALQKAQKRPTRLKRLRITDVSSVDRGAGVGVRVMLAKRDGGDMDREEEIKPMSTIEKSERFKRAFDDAVDAYVAKHGCPRARAVEVFQGTTGIWGLQHEITTTLHAVRRVPIAHAAAFGISPPA